MKKIKTGSTFLYELPSLAQINILQCMNKCIFLVAAVPLLHILLMRI